VPPVDKAALTRGKLQYHLHLRPGDVGPYVLLPGDPARVLRIAGFLRDAREVAFNREFRTWTGTYEGVPVSATSTGIGCPSAAIAVEELANVGARAFVRVGTTGGLQPRLRPFDLILNHASLRREGTTRFYAPDGFPAVADHFLTHALIEAAGALAGPRGFAWHVGINASDDAFYGETPEDLAALSRLGVLNVEMEGAAIFTVAYRRGLRAAMVCTVANNLLSDEVHFEGERPGIEKGIDDAIAVALDAIARDARRTASEG
jgi:uridine phosphorylase